jgi:hypothetical protein
LYLLEWVAIAFLGELPTDRLGDDAAAIAEAYTGEARSTALAAGWFSVVLLGRILFVVAVRKAFRDSGRESALLDFAVGAMTVSVAIEIVSFSLAPAAAWLAANDAEPATIVALDAAGSIAFLMVFAPIGVSVLAASAAMVDSRLFARWVGWLGLGAGALMIAGGILGAAALGDDGGFKDWGAQPIAIGALAFWIWILATGVILWRRSPRREMPAAGLEPAGK